MGKLKAVPQMLAPLTPKVGWLADGVQDAPQWRPWRKWYNTTRWRRLRWAALVADAFTCRMCGRVEGDSAQLVADHLRPHRGDEALFFDPANLQCLCKPCHDGAKQRHEQRRW